jgi:hypothetical protein
MSTNDVPGANPVNQDELRMGCWAEHDDGSLIFVKSVENERVIFEMYDTSASPIVQYTDAMLEPAFKKQFSFDAKNKKSIKWIWHDKTGFPWDRVIKAGARDGLGYASAEDQLSAAGRVAVSLALRGKNVDPEALKHLMDAFSPEGRTIASKLQEAISTLPTDDKVSKKKAQILADAQKKIDALDKKPKGLLARIMNR